MFDERLLDKKKMSELGYLGEQVTFKVLKEKFGSDVKFSESAWDSEKDMTINGVKCEVKTQVPFLTQNSFAIKESQHQKCAEAEVLIFVEIPYNNRYGKNDAIKVWLSNQADRHGRKIHTKHGRDMILYHRNQLKKMATIRDPELCAKMERLTQSQV